MSAGRGYPQYPQQSFPPQGYPKQQQQGGYPTPQMGPGYMGAPMPGGGGGGVGGVVNQVQHMNLGPPGIVVL